MRQNDNDGRGGKAEEAVGSPQPWSKRMAVVLFELHDRADPAGVDLWVRTALSSSLTGKDGGDSTKEGFAYGARTR